MGFSKAFTEEVRGQADIVRIISDYIALKKRGKNYLANCPFHSEKTPSFNVNPARQIFHCFGCNVGGDVFGFVMRMEHCEFGQAIKLVAEKLGIPLPQIEHRASDQKYAEEREDLIQLNTWATEFFQEQLESIEGQRAQHYFAQRGLSEETIKNFRLGYAPDKWDALSGFLRTKGATVTQIERSGLVILKESGTGFYDRFRGRCMFPICDAQGRVIAFGGRTLGDGEPKYLNSPETPLYTKGRNLFGLNLSKEAIRRQRFAILVEGYLDFIIPYQEGVQNMVASLGTALTDHQVRLLGRYMDQPQIVVNFDPDTAGVAATRRSLEILLEQGYKVNVLSLPDGEDPDTFIRKRGAAEYRQLLKKSQPYLDYILTQSMREHDATRPAGKVETLNAVLPFLIKVPDRIERAEYAEHIADRLKLDGKVVREELKRAAMGRRQQLDPAKLATVSRVLPAERRLLELLLSQAQIAHELLPQLTPILYGGLVTEPIFSSIKRLLQTDGTIDFAQLSEMLNHNVEKESTDEANRTTEIFDTAQMEQCRSLLSGLMIGSPEMEELDEQELRRQANESLSSLMRSRLEQQKSILQIEINQAQREGNNHLVTELTMKKLALGRQIKDYFDN